MPVFEIVSPYRLGRPFQDHSRSFDCLTRLLYDVFKLTQLLEAASVNLLPKSSYPYDYKIRLNWT